MSAVTNHYLDIRSYRDQRIGELPLTSAVLNERHDDIMLRTIHKSMELHSSIYGPPPSPFCFFLMGSAGRKEQGVWSDQDHGIIYDSSSDETKLYFVSLGEEISAGLAVTGYQLCDGKVMASNPFWCRSRKEWVEQAEEWTNDQSWESIRHLLTFLDGRCLIGEEAYLMEIKSAAYRFIHHKRLISRMMENTMHVKKAVNMLGQFLVETHGAYSGLLNIKETGLFPYINAGRILAISENLMETSTAMRLKTLPSSILSEGRKKSISEQFIRLQDYRIQFGNHKDYESGHYLFIDRLTKAERKELKELIKDGQLLNEYVRKFAERKEYDGDE